MSAIVLTSMRLNPLVLRSRCRVLRAISAVCVSVLSLRVWVLIPSAAAQSSAPSSTTPQTPPATSDIAPATETRTAADSAANAPAVPVATPLLMTGFPIPHTPVDLRALHLLRGCQALFQRAIDISVQEALDSVSVYRAQHHTPGQQIAPESTYVGVPDTVVAMGRRCLVSLGDTKAFPSVSLPLLLRYAIWIDDDTLVQNVVARQLAVAGPVVRDRGHVLAEAIDELLHNQLSWRNVRVHRTPAHDALAFRYAAQIDTMQPLGQVLLTRLRVSDALDQLQNPVWNVDHALAQLRASRTLMLSVPLASVAPADVANLKQMIGSWHIGFAWATYLKTPTHATLADWIATRDSFFNVPKGETMDSLIDRPAPRLEGDFWFNLPAGTPSPPVVPAPGVLSLLMFTDSLSVEAAKRLQQLHTQYPALQLVLVSMTKGGNEGTALSHEQLTPEAEQIAKRFTDVLQFPVTVCVLETKYHTEADAKDIPVASPILNRFHLDPLAYQDHVFLIDAQGWLLEDRTGVVMDGRLLRRLFEH